MASYSIIKAIKEDSSDLYAAKIALAALYGLINCSKYDEISRSHAKAYIEALKERLGE